MKVIIEKEKGAFALKAEGIQTKDDVQEIIHQLQLVEGQVADGLKGKGILSDSCFSKGVFRQDPVCAS